MSEIFVILTVALQHSYNDHSKQFGIVFILLKHKVRIKTVTLHVQKSYEKHVIQYGWIVLLTEFVFIIA